MLAKKKKKNKKNKQNIIFSILIAIFLLAFAYFLISSTLKISRERAKSVRKLNELRKDVEDLTRRNEELKKGITRSEEDDYWKGKLYEQGYVQPGEEAIVILPAVEEEKEVEETEQKSWFEKVKEAFKF